MVPEEIRGVRVVDRAPLQVGPSLALQDDGVTWRIDRMLETGRETPLDSDKAAIDAGYIAVVPMRVDEVDLAAATVYGRDNQKRLGAVMVELGILAKSVVKPELHEHTLNLASIPLAWSQGTIEAVKSDSEIMPVVLTDKPEEARDMLGLKGGDQVGF